MEERTFPRGTLRICLDEYRGDRISGRIYSRLQREPVEFASLGAILLKGEEIFDKAGYPMAFRQRRSFSSSGQKERQRKGYPMDCALESKELAEQKGKLETLDVIVSTRRHSSWQGVLLKSDGELIDKFDSELELLKMLARISMELGGYL